MQREWQTCLETPGLRMCEGWSGLKDGEELDHWRRGGMGYSLRTVVWGGAERGGGKGRRLGPIRRGFRAPRVACPQKCAPTSHPRPTAARGSTAGSAGQLTGGSGAGRGRFLQLWWEGGGGGTGGGGGAARELGGGRRGVRPARESFRVRASARSGVRGPRRLYQRFIGISLPRDSPLGAARSPPRPAGWCRKAWHPRCRVPLVGRRPGPILAGAEEPENRALCRCLRPQS